MQAIHSQGPVGAAPVHGKSAQSMGHQAKAAVAAAREAGTAVPKNAQGVAASAIARGADPASVFAAVATPEQPTDPAPVAPETDQIAGDVDAEETATPAVESPALEAAMDGYASASAAMTADEAALELLQAL